MTCLASTLDHVVIAMGLSENGDGGQEENTTAFNDHTPHAVIEHPPLDTTGCL